jgi:hypothetical protein
VLLGAGGSAPAAPAAPVVWVQPGHLPPLEPGYRDQTGAGSGPFGSELAFTRRLAGAVESRLRAAGVDARETPGRVTPDGATGATFISLHQGASGDHAGVGYAITGRGENWYHGEGEGAPSPVPYPDSAPHRRATVVTATVEGRSRALAARLAARIGRIHRPANGAGGVFDGVEPAAGNVRMEHYYGFYRTRADARVIVECGPADADRAFLSRVDLIAAAVAGGVVDDLRARGLLGR